MNIWGFPSAAPPQARSSTPPPAQEHAPPPHARSSTPPPPNEQPPEVRVSPIYRGNGPNSNGSPPTHVVWETRGRGVRRAIQTYETELVGYLPFKVGDELIVVDHPETDGGWVFAERECNVDEWEDVFCVLYVNGCEVKGKLVVSGWVPDNFLEKSPSYYV